MSAAFSPIMNVAAFVCAAGMSGTENETIWLVVFLSFKLIAWTYWSKHRQRVNDQYHKLAISHSQRLPYLLQSPFYMCQPMNREFLQFFLLSLQIALSHMCINHLLDVVCSQCMTVCSISSTISCQMRAFYSLETDADSICCCTVENLMIRPVCVPKKRFISEWTSTFWDFFCNKRQLASFAPAIRLLRSSGCSK